ncbi:UDP-N-acetylglucosamine:LPS N-acetylglucosamine transferase [Burkholderiales bacterium JOSHI_001]|nr:UDP-N-acetylglucosamine:LPS N-acetylglucosamine transferase [Burkholderiales bacterium JOSHI_001]
MNTPKVDLVYFNAGGGHRAAATALQAVMAQQHRPWTVRTVNLFEVLDDRQRFKRWLGMAPEDLYNRRLAGGNTRGMRRELRLLQGLIRLAHGALVRRLCAHWQGSEPQLVVSLVPNFNRCLFDSLARARPGVPYVTVLTDMADFAPHFWIEDQQPQHFICGTDHAVQQALALGHAPQRVHRVSGMILRPDFYDAPEVKRESMLVSLGLDPLRPVGLVMFGGHGARQMLDVARSLPDVQLILICGHNGELADRLVDLRRPAPHAVVGFTREVARYMAVSDFFIGKPGPGCISEALQCGLPVVTFANAATIPQERYNADWLLQREAGVVVDAVQALPMGVRQLMADLPRYRQRARAIENRAVFEVPDILAQVLRRAGAGSAVPDASGCAAPRAQPA